MFLQLPEDLLVPHPRFAMRGTRCPLPLLQPVWLLWLFLLLLLLSKTLPMGKGSGFVLASSQSLCRTLPRCQRRIICYTMHNKNARAGACTHTLCMSTNHWKRPQHEGPWHLQHDKIVQGWQQTNTRAICLYFSRPRSARRLVINRGGHSTL